MRQQDRPLHADVRRLADTLGEVVRRLEGDDAFAAVEALRTACRARRQGEPGAPDLQELVALADTPVAAVVGRAFTLFFLLVNTAEQVHRVRRRRSYPADPPQPASPRHALAVLRDAGRTADQVADALRALEIRPVLTAHPTESTRRTLLALQARVAALLLDRPDDDRALAAEVELLWLTSEVRRDRPSVLDEVSTVVWYLEERLATAASDVAGDLREAYEAVFDRPLAPIAPFVPGTWVGGDRDGNPFVTPEVTLAASRRAAHAILGVYHDDLERLTEVASASAERIVPSAALDARMAEYVPLRDDPRSHEPLRRLLDCARLRVAALREQIAAADAGSPRSVAGAYVRADDLLHDLGLVRAALAPADAAVRTHVDPLIARVRAHGFHGLRMDLREDAGAFREPDDRVRAMFQVARTLQDELGDAAVGTCIASMAKTPDDLRAMRALAEEAGLGGRMDLVPLFETLADLENGPGVIDALLRDPAWRAHLATRGNVQEVMIGYSDSAKDAGLLPAAWALYRAQRAFAALARKHGVRIVLFHGQGGSVGRGGGSPVSRALAALPPGAVAGRLKITEQGEVISQKYGLTPIAERSLEVLATGALLADLAEDPPDHARYAAELDALAAAALPVFRDLVHGDPALFQFFLQATPVRELANVHYGSRPAYRESGTGSMKGIRAIPWVFGWTQTRWMLPGWLGVGTALSARASTPDGLAVLREMAERWAFFDDFLAKVELNLAKSDIAVARAYAEALGGDPALVARLAEEHARTVDAVRAIRGGELLDHNPMLQASIALRNPYVDALSALQIALLRRKRAGEPDLDGALGTVTNGIAQGLRNTG